MSKTSIVLLNENAKQAACRAVQAAEIGQVMSLVEQTKKRAQEQKYHAMIGDISKQMLYMGRKYDKETWKRLLIAAFVIVLRENAKAEGKPDPFPEHGMVIPTLDGQGFIQVGVPSSGFTVNQAGKFIEYLNGYGIENGIRFSAGGMYDQI